MRPCPSERGPLLRLGLRAADRRIPGEDRPEESEGAYPATLLGSADQRVPPGPRCRVAGAANGRTGQRTLPIAAPGLQSPSGDQA